MFRLCLTLASACAIPACGSSSPGDTGDLAATGALDGGGDQGQGGCAPSALRPSARYGHSGVWVPTLGRIVAYGGDSAPFDPMGVPNPKLLDDLWAWDPACAAWSLLPSSHGPGKRDNYGLAYDSKRDRVLLMGGLSNDGRQQLWADVWAWEVAKRAWSKLAPTGGPLFARQRHAVAYDPATDRLLVYGGNKSTSGLNPVALGDTWALSFAGSPDGAWAEVAGAGPDPRVAAASTVDPKTGRWLLFGGLFDFTTYSNEIWSFDFSSSAWTLLKATGTPPSERLAAMMAFSPADARALVFGGHDGGNIGLLNDLWSFTVAPDGKSVAWQIAHAGDADLGLGNVDKASPERRDRAAFVFAGGSAWLFGGISDCGALDDAWVVDGAWSNPWKAQVGETCARRATDKQTCPSDCGPPL